MDTADKIIGILFANGYPLPIRSIAKLIGVPEASIKEVLPKVKELLPNALVLLEQSEELQLATAPEVSPLLESMQDAQLSGDLSRAAAETLAILLYKSPISRAEIDFIRGVNSTFILRTLSIRGLVQRIVNPKDQRGYLYRPTVELLKHLGISTVSELPEYDAILQELEAFEQAKVNSVENE